MIINSEYDDEAYEFVEELLSGLENADGDYYDDGDYYYDDDDDGLYDEEPVDTPNAFVSLHPDHIHHPENLLNKMLENPNYRGMVVAFLEACSYDSDFQVESIPDMYPIYHRFCNYGDNAPDRISISTTVIGPNYNGTQYATFDPNTQQLTYTSYTVNVGGSYHNRSGTGKLPTNKEGYFII